MEDQEENGKIVLKYVNIKEIRRVGMNGIDLIRIRQISGCCEFYFRECEGNTCAAEELLDAQANRRDSSVSQTLYCPTNAHKLLNP